MNLQAVRIVFDRGWVLLTLAGFWFVLLPHPGSAQVPTETNAPAALKANSPPTPVPAQSLIQYFRQLLAMSPQERDQALAAKTPSRRALLLAKIKEYQEMPEKDRELRFYLLQLRLYMLPLMQLPPPDRAALLAAIPAKDRPAVQSRLRDWDKLLPDQQTQVLQNETNLHYFLYRRYASPALEKEALAKIMPKERSREVEKTIAQWQSLPEAQRQRIGRRLREFLALQPAQRQEMLLTLPEEDRLPIQQISQRLTALSPEQQASWVDGFKTYAGLSLEERRRFILQAERWQTMTKEERDLWRSIVTRPPDPPRLLGTGPASGTSSPARRGP